MTYANYDHIDVDGDNEFFVYDIESLPKNTDLEEDEMAEAIAREASEEAADAACIVHHMTVPLLDKEQVAIDIAMEEYEDRIDHERSDESSTYAAAGSAMASERTMPGPLKIHRRKIEKSYDLDWMLQLPESEANMGTHLVADSDADAFKSRLGAHLDGIVQCLTMLDADELIENMLDGVVVAFNRQMERASDRLQRHQDELSECIRQDEGTEIDGTKMQEAQAGCYLAERHEQIHELACIAAQQSFSRCLGRPWTPNSRAFAPLHSKQTAAKATSTEWKKRRAKTEDDRFRLPVGTVVAMTGGYASGQWTFDKLAMWEKFDKLRLKYSDLVLVLTDETGANREAAKWAEKNNVPFAQITADFGAHGKAAAFRRNDEVLRMKPKALLTFEGNGPSKKLAELAKQSGVQILSAR